MNEIAEIYCQRCTQKEDCETSPCDWECKLTLEAILALIERREKPMREALKVARCPDCDGSGAIPHRITDRQYVTRDMASDAGNPALEGSLYSCDGFELEQCQWCDERKRLLEEFNG